MDRLKRPALVLVMVLMVFTTKTQAQQELSICPTREITASSGQVTSPGFLDDEEYDFGLDCTLTINAEKGKRFKIELEELSVQPDLDVPEDKVTTKTCRYDALVIDSGNKKHTRCYKIDPSDGDEPEEFTTTSNKLVLRFYSSKTEYNNRQHARGFFMLFNTETMKVDGVSICPTRHIKGRDKRSGTIFSPGFPGNYGEDQDCKIRIPIPDNFQMNVWFSDFTLQRSPTCQNDKLSIRDEHGGRKMCGGGPGRLPSLQELKGSLSKFHFKSDNSINKQGFRLHYNMTRLARGHCMCTRGSSYICMMNLNRKVRRLWHRIKFYIRTSQEQSLIMYSKGKLRDYIYIGIHEGKMFYKSDLGTGSTMVVTHKMKINDDKWHYIEIRRRKRLLTIAVDNGKTEGRRTRGNFNKIDLPDSIGYFLGTPPQLQGIPNFIGCIKDFTVDGREPLTNAFVYKPEYPSHGMLRMTQC